jgi:hypothetical protein
MNETDDVIPVLTVTDMHNLQLRCYLQYSGLEKLPVAACALQGTRLLFIDDEHLFP